MRPRQRHSHGSSSVLPQLVNTHNNSSLKRRRFVARPLPICIGVVVIAILLFCFQFYLTPSPPTAFDVNDDLIFDVTRAIQSVPCSNTTSLVHRGPTHIPAVCSKRWYRKHTDELPTAELVIAADAHTCPGSILRTAALARLHSKPNLLVKVWVTTSTELSDEILDALQSLPQTTILYRPELHTISALRNDAADNVRSPVVVFLTPGVLPAQSWLEPLLAQIAEDEIKGRRLTLALPADTPPRNGAPPPTVGHDWSLRRLLFARVHASGFAVEATAAESPLMPHSDFAVSTKYWQAIGGYEDGGDTELAFRVWQCGASVALIPCSRVHRPNDDKLELRGHVKRLRGNLNREGRLRVARRWMGPYAMLAEFANGQTLNSTQVTTPGEEGRCPPEAIAMTAKIHSLPRAGYREYMGSGFPEMQPSAQIMLGSTPKLGFRAWGKLRLVGHDTCVSLVNRTYVTVKCEEASIMLMSREGYMFSAPRMTATCVTRKDELLVSSRCDVFWESRQSWQIETRRETSIYTTSAADGEPVCLTALKNGRLESVACSPEKENRQTWVWQYRAKDEGVGNDNRADMDQQDDDG